MHSVHEVKKKNRFFVELQTPFTQSTAQARPSWPFSVKPPWARYDVLSLPLEGFSAGAVRSLSGMQYPKYSIVIPAYNESARIPATLASVVACIRAKQWPAEVIVVNDGSTDSTAQIVRDFALQAPEVRLIENPGNRGKGYSVR